MEVMGTYVDRESLGGNRWQVEVEVIVDAPSAPEALQRVIDALEEAERLR